MMTRPSHVRWVLVSSTGLLLVLAVAYLGGASLLSAPRKPPAPATPVVVDGTGNTVGAVASVSEDTGLLFPVVIVNTSAGAVALFVYSDHLEASGDLKDLYFTGPGCTGTLYITAGGLDLEHSALRRATVYEPDGNLYVAGTTKETAYIQSRREAVAGGCIDELWGNTSDRVQAVSVGNIYNQYPPPYSVEWR